MVSGTAQDKIIFVRTTIPVDGLSCRDDGALMLEQAIRRVEGVRRAYVNVSTEMAYIENDPANCTCEQLAATIGRSGLNAGKPIHR